MILKQRILLLILVVLMLLITGCQNTDSEQATVKFLYWTEASENHLQMEKCLDEYTRSSGKIIERIPTPHEFYQQRLSILFGAKSLPDLFLLTPEQLMRLREKKALLVLNDYYQKTGISPPNPEEHPDFYDSQGQIHGLIIDGRIYAIFSGVTDPDESWELLKFLLAKL